MRLSPRKATFLLVFLLFATNANAQSSAPTIIANNLSLGSRGAEVVALQKILNSSSDTQISLSGAGSPGNETDYFGTLTQSAVIRFQNKYASDVLYPANLSFGTGYVGLYTRNKLNTLASSVANAVAPANSTAPTGSIILTTPNTNSPGPNTSHNTKNLDSFLMAVDSVGTKQGFSKSELDVIRAEIVKEAATTTDLRATFIKMVKQSSNQALTDEPSFGSILSSIAQTFVGAFAPERAHAATGIPFGGALVYTFYCNCSQTWLIGITPLPPTYVSLLTYVPGSQAYLSYNIPATEWLLGEYAVPGLCFVIVGKSCAPLPSQGMITPLVGSSPL